MKALTTTGLTQLIQLIKDNYIANGTLATVASTGSYSDLINKPTINDLTTATQLNAINSGITSALVTQIGTNQSDITTINDKIPSAASDSNQLADKAFVNSTVTTLLARYITSSAGGDSFATHAALAAGPYYLDGTAVTTSDLHNNDYAMVMADETHDGKPARYIWSGTQWSFQYVLNNTTFTQAQVDAMNSGITSSLVTSYNTHIADTTIHVTSTDKTNWNAKQAAITGAASTVTTSDLTASRVLISDGSGKIAADANVTTTELGYLDGVTSAIQTQLNNKQATLVGSGTGQNIKTINNTSLLGSGNIAITGLPSQSSQSGKYLTTNGTTAAWANIPTEIPSQTGNSGKYLTTNGTSVSWAVVDALPSQTSQSGKFLTTDGSNASWTFISQVPDQTDNEGKFLTTDGSAASWAEIDAFPDQTGNSGKYLKTNGTEVSWSTVASYDSANKRLVLS